MYGRVSNHEIIIPYLAPFVGSGVSRVWRGVIVGVCGEGVGVVVVWAWRGYGCECVWSVDVGVGAA